MKSRIIPWHGGVYLILQDQSLLPVRWKRPNWGIESKTVVIGIFLPGAVPWALPEIEVNKRSLDGVQCGPAGRYTYLGTNGGTNIVFEKPLVGDELVSFHLSVTCLHPWNGYNRYESSSGFMVYRNHVEIHFCDRTEPYG